MSKLEKTRLRKVVPIRCPEFEPYLHILHFHIIIIIRYEIRWNSRIFPQLWIEHSRSVTELSLIELISKVSIRCNFTFL